MILLVLLLLLVLPLDQVLNWRELCLLCWLLQFDRVRFLREMQILGSLLHMHDLEGVLRRLIFHVICYHHGFY